MEMTSVIYARVSSVGDRQSTERQVADLSQYAVQCNSRVVRVFEEHISGAKQRGERPVLDECLEYCFANKVGCLLLSELSRLGRNVDDVLANVRLCKEKHLNIYFQKENISIFQSDGSENPFLTIMIAVLATCAQMERENIKYRLNSGRKLYVEKGGKLGRKEGSVKTQDQKREEYAKVIRELKKGTSVRNTAAICKVSVSTVQRVKKEFEL